MTTKSKQLTTFILMGALCISTISLTGCKKESEPTEPVAIAKDEPMVTTNDELAVTTNEQVSEQK